MNRRIRVLSLRFSEGKTMSDELTEDDLVTWDDLPEAVSDAIEDADVGSGEPEGEDAPWLEPDDAAEITERKMTEFMHHLTHEECDTPECQEFRDAIGIGGESEPDGGASSEGGADADAEPDETDETEPETEADEGNDDREGSEGESGEKQSEPDSSDDDSDDGDDANTNYLGEGV